MISTRAYSHRLNGKWLVGGASNLGGWVLRRFFTNGSRRSGENRSENYRATSYFAGVMLGFSMSVDEASSMWRRRVPKMTPIRRQHT